MSKIKIKSSLSVVDVALQVKFLKETLRNCYIAKIYQIDEIFIFRLRNSEGNEYLLTLSPKHGIWITKYKFEYPSEPPPFCKMLRKYLLRGRIRDIEQYDFDRIVIIRVKQKTDNYSLVLELVREGNLILLDSSNKIILALRQKVMKDRVIRVGEYYQPPPLGCNIITLNPKVVIESIKEKRGKVLPIISRLLSLPAEIVNEVFKNMNLDVNLKVKEISDELLEKIINNCKDLVLKLINKELHKPVIVFKNNDVLGVYPYKYKFLEGLKVKEYASFNDAIDEYFKELITKGLTEDRVKELEKQKAKLIKVIREQEKTIDNYLKLAKMYRDLANNLFSKYPILEELFRNVELLKKWPITKNKISHLVEELEELGITIKGFDFKEKCIMFDFRGVKFSFYIRKNIGENLSDLYNKAKEFEQKAKRARKALEEIKAKLKEIESGIAEERRKVILSRVEKKEWYERFRWFFTSEGFLVIAGRNLQQNEKIVRKYLDDNDIFLHADIRGAAVVVIKSGGKKVGQKSIEEAAQFAAVFSKAWYLGFSAIDVFWVYGNQVSKSPPSGEYLPKGSFMIYGKRNYIKGVPLRIALGILLQDHKYKLIVAPPSVVKRLTDVYVELIPGNLERRTLAERILKSFYQKLRKKYEEVELKVSIDEIIQLLPEGKGSLIT